MRLLKHWLVCRMKPECPTKREGQRWLEVHTIQRLRSKVCCTNLVSDTLQQVGLLGLGSPTQCLHWHYRKLSMVMQHFMEAPKQVLTQHVLLLGSKMLPGLGFSMYLAGQVQALPPSVAFAHVLACNK